MRLEQDALPGAFGTVANISKILVLRHCCFFPQLTARACLCCHKRSFFMQRCITTIHQQ